jgi:ABC-type uncharacterized transport system ATPase subunit
MGTRGSAQASGTPLLAVIGVSKAFPDVVASDDVSFELQAGEVLGILGENGAGKSTLMNILTGLLRPDRGAIMVNGNRVEFASPTAAAAGGIGMVHQHFKLVGTLSVAENLALGDPRWGAVMIDYPRLRSQIEPLADKLGMTIVLDAKVDGLSIGQQQQVEILKALSRRPRILILDEPTAVLAPAERDGLFAIIRGLADSGVGIILISHRLEDTLEVCDRVLVLRRGRVVGGGPVAGSDRAALVRMIVGDDIAPVDRRAAISGEIALSVRDLQVRRDDGSVAVVGLSFDLKAGEVLGLCGIEGNGQSELVHALAGMREPEAGTIEYRLAGLLHRGPLPAWRLRALGVAHVAEDRHRHATLPAQSLTSNWRLTNLHSSSCTRFGWPRTGAMLRQVGLALERYAISAPGPHALIGRLSGGNQQKFVLARELVANPKIVLAAYPTRGLDVRTIDFLKRELLRARIEGAAILLLSADLAELWDLSDRIMAMAAGRLHGPVPLADTTQQEVGRWMTSR